jgi:hypothetical protein
MRFLSSPAQAILPRQDKRKGVSKYKRTRLLVDPAFQYRLLFRVVLYGLLWTVVAFHFSFVFYVIGTVFQNGPRHSFIDTYLEFFSHEKALLVTLVLVAPLILFDLSKFSNRIAGPLYRCRKVMRAMAAGKSVPAFQPREKDLMKDLFDDFNALIREWNDRLTTEPNSQVQEHTRAQSQECPQ